MCQDTNSSWGPEQDIHSASVMPSTPAFLYRHLRGFDGPRLLATSAPLCLIPLHRPLRSRPFDQISVKASHRHEEEPHWAPAPPCQGQGPGRDVQLAAGSVILGLVKDFESPSVLGKR